MTTFQKNLLEGSRTTQNADGYEQLQAFKIADVPGGGEAQEFNALQDARIPQFGQPHAVIPDIQVTNRSASAQDEGIVLVEITYSRPSADQELPPPGGAEEGGLISIGAAISSTETNFDAEGRSLTVTFTGAVLDDEGNETEVSGEEQLATAQVQRPQLVVRFSRRERSSPSVVAQAFVSTVNDTRIGTFNKGSLLCTRIDAESSDNGLTFDVSYEFQHNTKGWGQEIAWIDPQTDRPPVDAKLGNGITNFEFYDQTNFGALNLPW